jgi:hypothetical protein
VEPQPGAGRFALPAIAVDRLGEDAVVVTNAVTRGRILQRRERIEKAGGQPPKAAIAEARIHFEPDHGIEIVAHAGHRRTGFIDQLRVDARQRIHERAARQEFDGQVTQALHPRARDPALCREPACGQFLPDGER